MEKFQYEGGIYEGEAVNGVPHGQGAFTNGEAWEGKFEGGYLVEGKKTFADGTV